MIQQLFLTVCLISFLITWIKRFFNVWRNRGFLQLNGKLPFGSFKGVGCIITRFQALDNCYKAFRGKAPAVGYYSLFKANLLLLDPNLIKNVLVHDFTSFHERSLYHNKKDDPLSFNTLTLDGQEWKERRAKLTPLFTSGKIKMMFDIIDKISDQLVTVIGRNLRDSNDQDMRSWCQRFTADNIGSIAFGIECNCIEHANSEFMKYGRKVVDLSPLQFFSMIFSNNFPNVARILGFRYFPKNVADFFMSIFQQTFEYRDKNEINRNDLVSLLLKLKDELDTTEMAAESILTFAAGYETSSTLMQFTLYELALNQEIQQRLRNEIKIGIEENGGTLTYELLNEFKYLDMVVQESLRKYPPIPSFSRRCSKDYHIPKTNLVIPKGTTVFVCAYSLQNDPEYFPTPEKFEPERFNKENEKNITPFTFLTFGEGPRQCLGMRFGVLQAKMGIAKLITNFSLSPCIKTMIPMKFKPSAPFLAPQDEETAFAAFNLCEYIGNTTIKSLIQEICRNVDLDFKPDLICGDCLNELKIACSFKQKCETSNQFIKNINFQTKFQIFDNDDNDFIDTNLFDEDYFMNENELKPDFEELLESDTKIKTESVSSFDSKGVQVESNQFIEKKKINKNSKRSMIKCANCEEDFTGPAKLIIHSKEVHNDLKPFKCKQCSRSYMNPKALKVHTRSHDKDKKFKCNECNASFHVKSSLISHSSIHSGQKYECGICTKSFSSLSYMRQHQATHTKTGENFICTFNDCHEKFPNQLALRSHLKVHLERKFICKICPSAFKTQQSLRIHSLKHSSGDSNLFQCHICGFATKYRQHFQDHVFSHSAKRNLECFHCRKKFKKKTLLVLHMQTHLSQRKFICKFENCQKSFKTYNSYYAHKRKHEMKNSPKFNCASCDKVFSSHSVLMAHRVIHTGEKTHLCHYQGCTKAYAHKQNLNMHLLTAHIQNGVTYQCDLCPKILANSNQLRVHLNKIHKAEKNFKCLNCEMRFSSNQLLQIHQKVHQPKIFNCEFCNYNSNYENDLKKHLLKAHEENKEV